MTIILRQIVAAAVFAAAMAFNIAAGHAFGDAPWCAVKNFGSDVVWDCQYRSVEECTPHVIAGDRSFCNLNPWPGPATPRADRRKRQAER